MNQEECIDFLNKSGWLDKNNKKFYEMGKADANKQIKPLIQEIHDCIWEQERNAAVKEFTEKLKDNFKKYDGSKEAIINLTMTAWENKK